MTQGSHSSGGPAVHEALTAEERYALVARAAGVILWEWDLASKRIRRWGASPLIGSLGLGVEDDDEDWARRVHPDDLERVRRKLASFARGGVETLMVEYRLMRPNGDHSEVRDCACLVRDAAGEPALLIGVMQDVTAQKAAERDLHDLQRELIHMSQSTAASTMATNLAHELNQPLTACVNYLAQIRMKLESLDSDIAREAMAIAAEAEDQVHRAGQTIRTMRALIRDGRPPEGSTTLNEVMTCVAKLTQATNARPDAVIHNRVKDAAVTLAADRMQVAQVILNLVALACDMAEPAAPEVAIASQVDEQSVEIEVRSMSGIDSATAKRAIAAFQGVPKAGTDLLSVARTLAEAQGGRIRAALEPDGAVSLRFTIPREPGT